MRTGARLSCAPLRRARRSARPARRAARARAGAPWPRGPRAGAAAARGRLSAPAAALLRTGAAWCKTKTVCALLRRSRLQGLCFQDVEQASATRTSERSSADRPAPGSRIICCARAAQRAPAAPCSAAPAAAREASASTATPVSASASAPSSTAAACSGATAPAWPPRASASGGQACVHGLARACPLPARPAGSQHSPACVMLVGCAGLNSCAALQEPLHRAQARALAVVGPRHVTSLRAGVRDSRTASGPAACTPGGAAGLRLH